MIIGRDGFIRQITRRLILRITQVLNSRQDLLSCLRPGSARSIEHVRNRGDGYSGPAGYIFDAYGQPMFLRYISYYRTGLCARAASPLSSLEYQLKTELNLP